MRCMRGSLGRSVALALSCAMALGTVPAPALAEAVGEDGGPVQVEALGAGGEVVPGGGAAIVEEEPVVEEPRDAGGAEDGGAILEYESQDTGDAEGDAAEAILEEGSTVSDDAVLEEEAAGEDALAAQATTIASGTWGTCPWEITSEGRLTVRPGTGASQVNKYDSPLPDSPWAEYADRVTSVVFVREGSSRVVLPADCWFLFGQMGNLTSASLSSADTSKVTSMRLMFFLCTKLTSLDVSGWDTSKVTDMWSMFQGCPSLASLDVSGWDTSSVTDMGGMFGGCSSLTSLDVSGWDTSKVTDMSGLFYGCSSLTSLDVSAWDTSGATNMGTMFCSCTKLASLDLSGWDTSGVEDMDGMFDGCSSLKKVSFGKRATVVAAMEDLGGLWRSEAAGRTFTGAEVAGRAGVADAYARVGTPVSLSGAAVTVPSRTYTGQALRPSPKVVRGGRTLVRGTDYTVSYKDNVNAGTATATVTGKGLYAGSKAVTFRIVKAANPMAAKATKASVSVRYRPASAAATAANVAVTGAQGAVTYANASTDATARGFSVNRATGRVSVPKATKVGTYTVRVKATAAGNANYKAASRTVSYRVAVIKAVNPITLRAVARTASLSAVASGNVVVARPLSVSGAQGALSYAKAGGSDRLAVNRGDGRVTVRKGTPAGTYAISIKVTAAGNSSYKAGSATVACKVTVR